MNKAAVIVAGGTGSRMQSDLPKQFIEIKGKPIIIYTIEKFLLAFETIELVVVCHKDFIDLLANLLEKHNISKKIKITEGGISRFYSSFYGLNAIENPPNKIVAIHDAARPFVTVKLIRNLFSSAAWQKSAIPVIEVTNTIRSIKKDNSSKHIDRTNLRKVQTPQCFVLQDIKAAYQFAINNNKVQFTDDASVFEFAGNTVFLNEGQINNYKITSPFDLQLAELLL